MVHPCLGLCMLRSQARIVFALSPNSAACERIFSLLKRFFGDEQMSVLTDYINAALKLAYNKRTVG